MNKKIAPPQYITVVAKSGNSEQMVVNLLDEICEKETIAWYQYWYGSGLWMIKIGTCEPENIPIETIQRVLEYTALDFCMIFSDEFEIFNETFVHHVDSRIKLQKMEAPAGETFKLNFKSVEKSGENTKPHPWAETRERIMAEAEKKLDM